MKTRIDTNHEPPDGSFAVRAVLRCRHEGKSGDVPFCTINKCRHGSYGCLCVCITQ